MTPPDVATALRPLIAAARTPAQLRGLAQALHHAADLVQLLAGAAPQVPALQTTFRRAQRVASAPDADQQGLDL